MSSDFLVMLDRVPYTGDAIDNDGIKVLCEQNKIERSDFFRLMEHHRGVSVVNSFSQPQRLEDAWSYRLLHKNCGPLGAVALPIPIRRASEEGLRESASMARPPGPYDQKAQIDSVKNLNRTKAGICTIHMDVFKFFKTDPRQLGFKSVVADIVYVRLNPDGSIEDWKNEGKDDIPTPTQPLWASPTRIDEAAVRAAAAKQKVIDEEKAAIEAATRQSLADLAARQREEQARRNAIVTPPPPKDVLPTESAIERNRRIAHEVLNPPVRRGIIADQLGLTEDDCEDCRQSEKAFNIQVDRRRTCRACVQLDVALALLLHGKELTTRIMNRMAEYPSDLFDDLGSPYAGVIAIGQSEPRGDTWTAGCALASVSDDPLVKSAGEAMKLGRTCVIDEDVRTLKFRQSSIPSTLPANAHDMLLTRGLHCPGTNSYVVDPVPTLCIVHSTRYVDGHIDRGERVLSTPVQPEKIVTHFHPLRIIGSEKVKDRELTAYLAKRESGAPTLSAASLPEKIVDFLVKRLASFGVTSPNSSMIGPEVTTQLTGLGYGSAIAVASRLSREDILPKSSEKKKREKKIEEKKTAAQIVAGSTPQAESEEKFECKKCKRVFKSGKGLDQHNRTSPNHSGKKGKEREKGDKTPRQPRPEASPPSLPPPPKPSFLQPSEKDLTYAQQLEKYQYELALTKYEHERDSWTVVTSPRSRKSDSSGGSKKNPLVDALKKTLGGGFYDLQKARKYYKKGKIEIPSSETVESLRAQLLN